MDLYNFWEANSASRRNPFIYVATPWNVPFISTAFCQTLRNIQIPFNNVFFPQSARHIADARNGICLEAFKMKASHIFMVDADQRIPKDAFINLWNILEQHGHENTIAYGWVILKTGDFAGKPGVFKIQDGKLCSIEGIAGCDKPVFPDAIGSAILLFSASILQRIAPPWFADLHLVHQDEKGQGRKFSEDEEKVVYTSSYITGQDVVFSMRAKSAGIKIICDPCVKVDHEIVGAM